MRCSHPGSVALAAGILMSLAVPAGAAGQVGSVAPGQAVRGAISAGDPTLAGGHGYHTYTFDGVAGQAVSVTLRSPDFDAYLVLARNSGAVTEELTADDDGAGGTDSRISYTLPVSGPYLLIVRGLEPEAIGAYTLDLGAMTRPAATVQGIRAGETRVGELGPEDDFTDDFSYYEIFTFQGRAGERVVASMRAADFDTYLEVGRWDGRTLSFLDSNDDGSEASTDSRLAFTIPATGAYALRATSLGPQASGSFSVSLEAAGSAASPGGSTAPTASTLSGDLSSTDARLDDGSYFDVYSYTGVPGERVTVTLRSAEFDTFLVLGHPDGQGGFSPLASDDDGAGGTDSELTADIPAGGVLLIRANSLSAGQTGRYTISIRSAGSS